jgi:hypothetical protein
VEQCGLGHPLLKAILKFPGTVVTHLLEELVARRNLDDGGNIAPGADGNTEKGNSDAQNGIALFVDAEAIVLAPFLPFDQLDDQIDLLPFPDRSDAKEMFNIDDPEAADLHMITQKIRAFAEEDSRELHSHLDDVIRYQPMPLQNQIQGTFALTDATLTHKQDPDAENIDQHPMHRR